MQNKKLQKRCEIACRTDKKYREDNNLVGSAGYSLTFGRHCMGLSIDLPEVGGRNPICVDQVGDCFSPLDRNHWRCMTTPDKLPPPARNGEHISIVAFEQMVLTFPELSQRINKWFADCTVPLTSSKWRRLEYITLGAILDSILRNRSADEVLA